MGETTRHVWALLWEAQRQNKPKPPLRKLHRLPSVARYHVRKLQAMGVLTFEPHKPGTVHVVQPYSWVEV